MAAPAAPIIPKRSRSRSPAGAGKERERSRSRSKSPPPPTKLNYRELNAKCATFWKAMKGMAPLSKAERISLSKKLEKEFAKPVEYMSKAKQHQFVYLKSCLRCVVDGCIRIPGDIQCKRCDYLHERYLSPTSLGDETQDLWSFLMAGLPEETFSYEEAVYLLHIAVRHGGIHGGEWELATKKEGVHYYPMDYMAIEAIKLQRILPDDVLNESTRRYDERADAMIKQRAAQGLPPEQDTTKKPGIYYGCTKCDTEGTKLDDKGLTKCCGAQPDGHSYELA